MRPISVNQNKKKFLGLRQFKRHLKTRALAQNKKIIFLASTLAVILALIFFALSPDFSSFLSEQKPSPSFPQPSEPSPLPQNVEQRLKVQPGVTISQLLGPFFSSTQELHEFLLTISPVYNLSHIKAGHNLSIKTEPHGEFLSLQYEIDKTHYLNVEKKEGKFIASIENIPFETKLACLTGVIEDNLIEAFNRAGEKDSLALALAEIFSWDIDFYLDLRTGDAFRLVFEKKFLSGEFVAYGDILAAEIINQGKKHQAFRFLYPDTGKADYFDEAGNSLRKEFLRSPIKYGRITSRFSFRRLHPIRQIYRPHFGVDYAAPVGTPVQATADGVIVSAGWNGASGRMIHIRHKNGYESLYLHLSRFAPGIKQGVRVAAGEVVGYVGSSGESTGPHLDYRLKYRGQYINPLAWRFQPAEPLRPEFNDAFRQEVNYLRNLLSFPFWVAELKIF